MNTTEGCTSTNMTHLSGTSTAALKPHAVFAALNVLNTIVGLPANSYIVWWIATAAGNVLAAEFFTLNLSILDIIFCLSTVLVIISYTTPSLFKFIFLFLSAITFTGRPLFQMLICVERYLAVVHPVIFLRYKPLRYRLACAAPVWLAVLVAAILGLAFLYEGKYLVLLRLCFAQNAVLSLIMSVCCVVILKSLKHPGPAEGGKDKKRNNSGKEKAFIVVLVTWISVMTYYPPLCFVLFFGPSLTLSKFNISFLVVFGLYIANVLLQPFLYRFGKLSFRRPN